MSTLRGCISIFVLLLAISLAAAQSVQVRIAVATARVFLNPDSKSLVLTTLASGTVVTIDQRESDWLRIVIPSANGLRRIGYVRRVDVTDDSRRQSPPLETPASSPTPVRPDNPVRSSGSSTWIASAIAAGQRKDAPVPVRIGRRQGIMDKFTVWKKDPGFAFFTTPYIRVALAAADAKQKMKSFSERDVPRWMLEPVVTVFVPNYGLGSTAITEHVVIRTIGSTSPGQALQPLRTRNYDESRDWIVQIGETRTGDAFVADFPVASLQIGKEFYLLLRQTSTKGGLIDDSHMTPVTFRITADTLALAGCPLACR